MRTGARTIRRPRRGPRLWRAVVLAPVLAALAAPAGVLPAAGAAPVPVLGARNVFTATSGAAVTVRVPRIASLLVDATTAHSADVAISGSGRMTGFVITARNRPDPRTAPTLITMRAGMCSAPRCGPAEPRWPFEYVAYGNGLPVRRIDSSTEQVTLPAGEYDVRAVTDGAPVRMTLRLAGLRGATTVRVTKPRRAVVRTDSSPPGFAGVDPLRNVGVSHTFASDLGFTMFVVLEEYEPHVRNTHGTCYYRNGAKPPTGRYHPGCPNADYAQATYAGAPALRYYGASVGSALMFGAADWTLGFYTSAVAGKSSLTVNTVWLDLG